MNGVIGECELCSKNADWVVHVQVVENIYRVPCCDFHADCLHKGAVNKIIDTTRYE